MLANEIKKTLNLEKNEKTLIVFIGNRLRSDDGIGLFIAEKTKKVPGYIKTLTIENNPENIIDHSLSIMPVKTIIIDAANFNCTAGEIKLIPNDNIPESLLSTHTFPLKAIIKILEKDTKSKVFFLGIQIRNTSLGESICKEVKDAGMEIIDYLKMLK